MLEVGILRFKLTDEDFTGTAVNAQPVAFFDLDGGVADRGDEEALGYVNGQFFGATDCRRTELSGDHSGMAGCAAAAGQNALGGNHAMDIVRDGFRGAP
jgi:hypothetical protein